MEKLYQFLKILIVILAVAVLIAGFYVLRNQISARQEEKEPAVEIPDAAEETADATETAPSAAPNFTVYDVDGNAYKLSDFQGKPVILNFWASWCGPCKSEMPEIQAAFEKYGNDIHFLIVDLADGRSETVEEASAYIAQQGYTFPVYYDTDMGATDAYGISAIPVTYFIDSEGYFVTYHVGAMPESTLQQGIDLLLDEE